MADPPPVTCSCCDDPEPGEFRLLTMLLVLGLIVGAFVMLRPWVDEGRDWLRRQDLLVPADQAALRLPGDVGLTWMTLGIGFATIVVLMWLVSRLLLLLGLTKR